MFGDDHVALLAAAAHPQVEWLPDPLVLAPLAVMVAIYVRRFRRARSEGGGRGAGARQAMAFTAGTIALLAALAVGFYTQRGSVSRRPAQLQK